MASASIALVAWLSAGLNFGADEWTLMAQRTGWTAADLLAPQNEHWSTLLILFYRAMLALFGLHSYLPYAIAEAFACGAVAVLVFMRIRRRWGTAPALACAAILFFYGSAAEDLLWDYQLGFAGAIACGLASLLMVESVRPGLAVTLAASVLLLLSLMWSGIGLIFLIAAGVEFSTDPRLRWALPAVAVGALTCVAWYATFGHQGTQGLTLTVSAAPAVAAFTLTGLMIGTSSLIGLPQILGLLLGLQILAVLAYRLARRWWKLGRVPGESAGAVVGVIAFFTTVGLARAVRFGFDEATASRYLLPAAVFLLPLAVEALEGVPRPRLVFGSLAAASVVMNLVAFAGFVQGRQAYLLPIKAEIAAVSSFRNAPGLDPNSVIDEQVLGSVTPAEVWHLTDAYGSPYPAYRPDQLATLPAQPLNTALDHVFASGVTMSPEGADVAAPCHSLSAGEDFRLRIPMGSSMVFSGGPAEIRMWFAGPEPQEPIKHVPAEAAPVSIGYPGPPGEYWWVSIRAVEGTDVVCSSSLDLSRPTPTR